MQTRRTETGIQCDMDGALLIAEQGVASDIKVALGRALDRLAKDHRVAVVVTSLSVPPERADLETTQAEFVSAFRRLVLAQIANAQTSGLSEPEAVGLYVTAMLVLECLLANTLAVGGGWPPGKTETDFQTDMRKFLEEVSRETLTLDRIHDHREMSEGSAKAFEAAASHEIPQGPTEEG